MEILKSIGKTSKNIVVKLTEFNLKEWSIIFGILLAIFGMINYVVDWSKKADEPKVENQLTVENNDGGIVNQNNYQNFIDPTPGFDVVLKKSEGVAETGCYSCRNMIFGDENPLYAKEYIFATIPFQFIIEPKGGARISSLNVYSNVNGKLVKASMSNQEQQTNWGTYKSSGYSKALDKNDTNLEIGMSTKDKSIYTRTFLSDTLLGEPRDVLAIFNSLEKNAKSNSMEISECEEKCVFGIFQNYFDGALRNEDIKLDEFELPYYENMFGYNVMEITDTGNKSGENDRKHYYVVLHKFSTV